MEDEMEMDMKKVNKKWRTTCSTAPKMYFFPSSSDIFEENVDAYLEVCKKIIDCGHEIFFTTKTSPAVVSRIADGFVQMGGKYVNSFHPYITITTDDNELLRRFEPRAPSFEDRVANLRILIEKGLNANVMMEPYLSDPLAHTRACKKPLLDYLLDIITNSPRANILSRNGNPINGTIVIGKMSYSTRLQFSHDQEEHDKLKKRLDELYSSSLLYLYIYNNKRIFLKKDSIMALLT
jgi:hypothetical protein